MNKSEFVRKLRLCIEKNEVEKACKALESYMGTSHDNLILLLSEYNENEEKYLQNIRKEEDYLLQFNKIKNALLAFLESDELPQISAKKKPFPPEKPSFISQLKLPFFGKNKEQAIPFEEISNEEKAKWAEELKKSYELRKAGKVRERLDIKIQFSPSAAGFDDTFVKIHFPNLSEEEKQQEYDALSAIFDKYNHRISLVGEAGAGKTVLLLKFAIEKLQEYLDNQSKPFPIILNLASWNSEMQRFEVWLEKVLTQSGFSAATAKSLAKEQPFLLLLDGLDEIRKVEDRKSCLKALSHYLLDVHANAQIVLCSRIKELAEAEGKLNVCMPFEVQPLTAAQIETELRKKAQEGTNLLYALESNQNAALMHCLQTPFYFATALDIFADPLENVPIFATKEEYQAYILPKYVNKQLHSPEMKYEKEEAEKYLRFLAIKMRERELLRLEMADLQPDWLEKGWLMNLVKGLIIIIIIVFIARINANLVPGITIGIITGTRYQKFSPQEIRFLSWKTWIKNWKLNIFTCLVIGLVSFGLSFFFGALDHYLVACIIGCAVFGFIEPSKTTQIFLKFEHPYSRFKAEMLWEIMQWTGIVWFAVGIAQYIIEHSMLGIYWGWTIGILAGIFNTALFSHICLLLCFRIEGTLPLLPHKFLDAMAHKDIALLEKDGGTWRFRHELLQDYFCKTP